MIQLTDLPYAPTALEPHISAQTLSFHHGKHHRAYVDRTNALTAGGPLAGAPLEDIIAAARQDMATELYNQAAQAWNHGFFWQSLSPRPGQPSIALGRAIEAAAGSLDAFKERLKDEAAGHFASGWAWIVAEGGAVSIETTHDAETMACADSVPLLVIDVWEHAYYLDHQNRRKDYLAGVVDNLLNWEFASACFAASRPWRYPQG